MNKWAEILLGLILIIVPIIIAWFSFVQTWDILGVSFNFWTPAWNFLKGGIFWFVVMIGVLFVLLGISDLRN